MKQSLFFSIALLYAASAFAEVKLPAIFSDHMVLQRQQEIPVWGWAAPSESVQVKLNSQSATAVANEDGCWSVKLPAQEAGGPYELVVQGLNTVRISDVMIGEVWLASGQSNMEWILKETNGAAEEIAASANPQIRIFKVQRTVADEARTDVPGIWRVSGPDNSGWQTAVGYYFAKFIQSELKVPVGIINSSWGGTPGISWVPKPVIQSNDFFREDLDKYAQACARYPEAKALYEKKLAEWQSTVSTPPTAAQVQSKPRPPYGPGHEYAPGVLYNGMVAPLVPYGIRGFLWYQGEANVKRAAQYRQLLPALITGWRESWIRPAMPFLIVQLANYRPDKVTANGTDWAELREAQTQALALPETGLAVTIDLGESTNIHPRNKREVGRRLALAAEKQVYGLPVVAAGPTLEKVDCEGGMVRIRYKADTATGLKTKDSATPQGFQIAGADKKFYPAEAKIDRETVLLTAKEVPNPEFVRYAWADDPVVNLVNEDGLPATPFRSE